MYGGSTMINRIGDAPVVMEAWCRVNTRNPGIFPGRLFLGVNPCAPTRDV